MVSRSCRVPTRTLQLSAKIPCVILFTVTHVSRSGFELVAPSWFSRLLAQRPQQELCDHVAKGRHSLSSLLDGPVKAHSSSLRNLEASVVFASKLLPQNCCRQQGTLCRKPASDSKRLPTTASHTKSCVRCPMPEVECSGDFIRALALLASSVQMSWMPMSLIHGALSDMLSSSARQPQYHLSSVLCMRIPLVCPCSVMVVLIFGSKTMMFRSHVSISPVS